MKKYTSLTALEQATLLNTLVERFLLSESSLSRDLEAAKSLGLVQSQETLVSLSANEIMMILTAKGYRQFKFTTDAFIRLLTPEETNTSSMQCDLFVIKRNYTQFCAVEHYSSTELNDADAFKENLHTLTVKTYGELLTVSMMAKEGHLEASALSAHWSPEVSASVVRHGGGVFCDLIEGLPRLGGRVGVFDANWNTANAYYEGEYLIISMSSQDLNYLGLLTVSVSTVHRPHPLGAYRARFELHLFAKKDAVQITKEELEAHLEAFLEPNFPAPVAEEKKDQEPEPTLVIEPESQKAYFSTSLPELPPKRKGWFSRLLSSIRKKS